MKTFTIIFGSLFLAVAVLIYWSGRNYHVTKDQVIALLRRILVDNGESECWAEWDNFTHIPITDDFALEKIRERCCALEGKEFRDPKLETLFNERGKDEIKKILAELEGNKS